RGDEVCDPGSTWSDRAWCGGSRPGGAGAERPRGDGRGGGGRPPPPPFLGARARGRAAPPSAAGGCGARRAGAWAHVAGVRRGGAGDDRGDYVPPRRAAGEARDRPAGLTVGEGGAVDVRKDLIGRKAVADMHGERRRVADRAHHDRVVDG